MDAAMVCVLGYVEDGDYVAHALEMDLIGVGNTWEEALQVLKGVVEAHISIVKDLGDDSLVCRPAPPHLFKRFKKAQEAQLRSLACQGTDGPALKYWSNSLAVRRELEQPALATA